MVNVANFLQSVLGGAPSQPAGSMFGGPEVLPVNTATMPRQAPMQAPSMPQVQAEPARPRRSLLQTIGGLSDVLARVGGAEALYQPTLDAREDRGFAQEDRMRQIDLDELKMRQGEQQIQSGDMEIENAQKAIAANAMRGLKAIQKSGGDITRAWPILAKQAGVDDESAAQLAELFGQDPNAIDGLITTLGGSPAEFGLQPFYAQGADGKLEAYQLGKDGTIQRVNLPEGQTPIDPLKFVDVGDRQVGVGTRSGAPIRILPKGEAPGKAADRSSRERIAGQNNRTRIAVAGIRGQNTGKKDDKPSGAEIARGAAPVVSALRDAVNRLYQSGGMSSPERSTAGTVGAMVRENVPGVERIASPEGFSARQDFERLTTVGIPSLLPLMGGLTLGGKNIDAAKELDTWRNAIASAKDYPSAIRAIEGFERRIAELTAAEAAPAPSPSRTPSRRAGGSRVQPKSGPQRKAPPKPTVSNW